MLHVRIQVQSVYFYIDSQAEYCHMQLNDSITGVMLNTQLKCQCYETQILNEWAEIKTQYSEKSPRKLKLIFFEDQSKFGEAVFNLEFYINTNLAFVVDQIYIDSQQKEKPFLTFSLAWQFVEPVPEQNPRVLNPYLVNSFSPQNKEMINRGQSPKRLNKKIAEEAEKRITHQSYTQWKDHKEYMKTQLEKKLKEQPTTKPVVITDNYNWSDNLRKPDVPVRVVSPSRRFGTPTKQDKMLYQPFNQQEFKKLNKDLDQVEQRLQSMNDQNSKGKKKFISKLGQKVKGSEDFSSNIQVNFEEEKAQKVILQFDEQESNLQESYVQKSQPNPDLVHLKEQLSARNGKSNGTKSPPRQQKQNLNVPTTKTKQLQESQNNYMVESINTNFSGEGYEVLLKENDNLKRKQSDIQKQFDLLSETYQKLREEYSKINNENTQLKQQVKFYEQQINLLQQQLQLSTQNKSQINQLPQRSNSNDTQFTLNYETLKKDYEFLQRENQMLRSQLDASTQNSNQLQKLNDKQQIEIYNLKNNLMLINQDIERYQAEVQDMKQQMKNTSEEQQQLLYQQQQQQYQQQQQQQLQYQQQLLKQQSQKKGSDTKLEITYEYEQMMTQLKQQLENSAQLSKLQKEELEKFKKQFIQIDKENQNLKKQNDNLNQMVESSEEQIQKLQDQLEEKKQEIIRIHAKNDKENAPNIDEGYKQIIRDKDREIKDQQEEIKQLKQKKLNLENQIEQDLEQIEQLNQQIANLKEDIQKLQADNQFQRNQITTIQNEQKQQSAQSNKNSMYQQQDQSFKATSFKADDGDNENLRQEILDLKYQQQKDEVKIDSLNKELEIQKTIVELSELEVNKLSQELQTSQDQIMSQKQRIADILNLIMTKGDAQQMEDVEKLLQYQNLTSLR